MKYVRNNTSDQPAALLFYGGESWLIRASTVRMSIALGLTSCARLGERLLQWGKRLLELVEAAPDDEDGQDLKLIYEIWRIRPGRLNAALASGFKAVALGGQALVSGSIRGLDRLHQDDAASLSWHSWGERGKDADPLEQDGSGSSCSAAGGAKQRRHEQ